MSDPRGLGLGPSVLNPSWFGGWVVSRPKGDEGWAGGTQEGWGMGPSVSDLRGLGFGSFYSGPKFCVRTQKVAGPKGVGSICVRTKRGLGLVPIRTQGGLGDGSVSRPKGVAVWVLRCLTQGVWGWDLPFQTQVGLGVGLCPDPRAMRVGQVGPKRVGEWVLQCPT
ncbi:hypothetical protein Peur_033565 [Populus x canadensis]